MPIDKMQTIMNDYRNGRITEKNMSDKLHLMLTNEDDEYYRAHEQLKKPKHKQGESTYSLSAEDEYLEGLRETSITDCIKLLEGIVSEEEIKVLESWVLNEETQQTIASSMGVTQQYISRIIKGIQGKCQPYHHSELFKPLLYKVITNVPRSKRKDAGAPKHLIRWPWEFLSKISMETKRSKQKYILQTRCVCPEYLQSCFGDKDTKCSHWECWGQFGKSTCSRSEVN